MSKDKKGKDGDYEVGHGKPPKQHKRKAIDVTAVLNAPLTVKRSGVRRKMPAFEVSVRRLVERGLKQRNLNAILEFLELCQSYGLLVPPQVDLGGGVITAPKGVNFQEWLESVTELVPDIPPNNEFD